MALANTASGRSTLPAGAQQAHLTHCLMADSVLNSPGFSVRASSTKDEELLRTLEKHPAFELPVNLWSKDPKPLQAPRRLSLIKLVDRTEHALIHSAYLQFDTVGRRGNSFTHILVSSRFNVLDALRSWGSPEWVVSCKPGDPKNLKAPSEIPMGVLTDDVLFDFLSDKPLTPTDAKLATLTVPERFKAGGELRRNLFSRFVNAIYLLKTEAADQRLYVHAEPGLLALLLFGAARLLPRGWTSDLTFSTYENPDTTLRYFDQARIIGTYLDDPETPLDADYLERYGLGIDTFHDICSNCLTKRIPKELDELLDLAMNRDKGAIKAGDKAAIKAGDKVAIKVAIDALQAEWHNVNVPLSTVGASLRRRKLAARAEWGTATIEEIEELRKSDVGRQIVAKQMPQLWDTTILKGLLADPRKVDSFRDVVISEPYLSQLRLRSGQALEKQDFPEWERVWQLVCTATGPGAKEQLRQLMSEVDLSAPGLAQSRKRMRTQWLRFWGPALPQDPSQILRIANSVELGELLAAPEIPAPWKAAVLSQAVRSSELFDRARQYLSGCDGDIFNRFMKCSSSNFEEDPKLLVKLVGDGPAGCNMLDRLMQSNSGALDVDSWVNLIRTGRLLEGASWKDYWSSHDRLFKLLTSLGNDISAPEVWKQCLNGDSGQLNEQRQIAYQRQLCQASDYLDNQNAVENAPEFLSGELRIALERLRLRQAIDHPNLTATDPTLSPRKLRAACETLNRDLLQELQKLFQAHNYARLDPENPEDRATLSEFRAMFCRFYEDEADDFEQCNQMFRDWCEVVCNCPKERQHALQDFLFDVVKSRLSMKKCFRLVNTKLKLVRGVSPQLISDVTEAGMVYQSEYGELPDEEPWATPSSAGRSFVLTPTPAAAPRTAAPATSIPTAKAAPTTQTPAMASINLPPTFDEVDQLLKPPTVVQYEDPGEPSPAAKVGDSNGSVKKKKKKKKKKGINHVAIMITAVILIAIVFAVIKLVPKNGAAERDVKSAQQSNTEKEQRTDTTPYPHPKTAAPSAQGKASDVEPTVPKKEMPASRLRPIEILAFAVGTWPLVEPSKPNDNTRVQSVPRPTMMGPPKPEAVQTPMNPTPDGLKLDDKQKLEIIKMFRKKDDKDNSRICNDIKHVCGFPSSILNQFLDAIFAKVHNKDGAVDALEWALCELVIKNSELGEIAHKPIVAVKNDIPKQEQLSNLRKLHDVLQEHEAEIKSRLEKAKSNLNIKSLIGNIESTLRQGMKTK